MIRLILLAHIGASLSMLGLIWFVQIVHYPLLASVDPTSFASYEQRHTVLTSWVVGPPMLIEAMTAMLLICFRPPNVGPRTLWTGMALLAVIWLSTALFQMPCHDVLSHGFDPLIHQHLVRTNWLRTIAWSLRGVLVLRMAWVSLR